MTEPTDAEPGAFLILAPYGSHLEIMKYPDSRVVKANCGHFVWLSPRGESHFERCYTVCNDCAEEITDDPDAEKIAVAGSLDWIRRTVGAQAADEAVAFMAKRGIREEGEAFRRQPPA